RDPDRAQREGGIEPVGHGLDCGEERGTGRHRRGARTGTDRIVKANDADIAAGTESGMSEALLDRLRLDADRIAAIADSVEAIVDLADPVGNVVVGRTLPNGIRLSQTRVPMGVIGAIYEARPNVTVDIAVLALKAGNATVLRGGSAAQNSNAELISVLR